MNVVLMASNYPYTLNAPNAKTEYMARGLQECGCKVIISDSLAGEDDISEIEYGMSKYGFKYYRFPRFRQVKYAAIDGIKMLEQVLKDEKEAKDNFLIIQPCNIFFFVRISKICHRIGYKLVALYHEYFPSFSYTHYYNHIDHVLQDSLFGYFSDGILPISHYLYDKCVKFRKPQLILPIISEFPEYDTHSNIQPIFTYCGSAGYILRNQIMLKALSKIHLKNIDAHFRLIAYFTTGESERLSALLNEYGIDRCTLVYSQIPQQQLIDLYYSSLGLLIPLDPNHLQDKARFSQKIADYLSTGRPIITNNAGEIPYYFTDRKNAIITDYSTDGFTCAMQFLIDNPQKADWIGENGRLLGIEKFDYKKNCAELAKFLKQLN